MVLSDPHRRWPAFCLLLLVLGVRGARAEDKNEAVDALCAREAQLASVYYENTSRSKNLNTGQELVLEIKIWRQGAYERSETGGVAFNKRLTKGVWIARPEGLYLYNSLNDTWNHQPPDPLKPAILPCEWRDPAMVITHEHVVGTDTVHGKPCTIIELSGTIANDPFVAKEWIWIEKGLTLKSEQTDYKFGKPIITTHAESSNFKFDRIRDNIFEVPRAKVQER